VEVGVGLGRQAAARVDDRSDVGRGVGAHGVYLSAGVCGTVVSLARGEMRNGQSGGTVPSPEVARDRLLLDSRRETLK
jgi:hypothetical protein